jgi:hypothetical protein
MDNEEEENSDCEEIVIYVETPVTSTTNSITPEAVEPVVTSPVVVNPPKKKATRKRKAPAELTPEQKKFAAAVNCKTINSLELEKATRDSRERKPFKQKYTAKNKRSKMSGSTIVKSVSAAMRIAEFPSESFIVKEGKVLWCDACNKGVSTKKSVIDQHVATAVHMDNKRTRVSRASKHADISALLTLKRASAEDRLVQLDLRAETYRVEVVEMLLSEGIHIKIL